MKLRIKAVSCESSLRQSSTGNTVCMRAGELLGHVKRDDTANYETLYGGYRS